MLPGHHWFRLLRPAPSPTHHNAAAGISVLLLSSLCASLLLRRNCAARHATNTTSVTRQTPPGVNSTGSKTRLKGLLLFFSHSRLLFVGS